MDFPEITIGCMVPFFTGKQLKWVFHLLSSLFLVKSSEKHTRKHNLESIAGFRGLGTSSIELEVD